MMDEAMERYRIAAGESAKLDCVASDLEEMKKIKFSELVNQSEASSIAKAEHWARTHEVYLEAHKKAVEARTAANVKKSEVKAMEMAFESWRTKQATKRAEMTIR